MKEGLQRLQKRLRAEKKVVDEKEKKYKEQQQHIAKLHADLKRITDGKLSHVRFMTHVERVSRLLSTLRSVMLSAKDMVFFRAAQEELEDRQRTAASEGQVHLDPQLQAEFYKIQEEAKSKTSKLRADHDTFQIAQVLLLSQCCARLWHAARHKYFKEYTAPY